MVSASLLRSVLLQTVIYPHDALIHRRIDQIWKMVNHIVFSLHRTKLYRIVVVFFFVVFLKNHFTHCYLNIACKYIITITTDKWPRNMTMLFIDNGRVLDN